MEIVVKAAMAHPVVNHLPCGIRTETFKKVCNALNLTDFLHRLLRWEKVRDIFKEAEDEADKLNLQGEEQWLKLRQN